MKTKTAPKNDKHLRFKKVRPNPNPELDLHDLLASVCRDSFFDFVKEFWHVVIHEEMVLNWHIEFLCTELQALAENLLAGKKCEKDLLVNIPPGTTKSTICSVMFPAWLWTRMPHCRVICFSHTHDLVLDLSRKCRDIVTHELYQKCFPEIGLKEDQNTKGYFGNTMGGWRLSVTVGGKTPTGFHAHVIIGDDPLDPQKAASKLELETANRFMDETIPSRKVDKEKTFTILVMQRLHQNDPSGNWLKKRRDRIRWINLPAEITEHVSPRRLRSKYHDGLLDPRRLSKTILEDQKQQLGEYGYAGQYQQHPIPRGGAMFSVAKLKWEKARPNKLHFKSMCRFWDKAATEAGGAFTVGVLMGLDKAGYFWILDVVRGQFDSYNREELIVKTARLDGKDVRIAIEQEPGSGGKESAEATVRRLRGYRCKLDKVTGDKELRADTFAYQVNAGNVRIVEANWNVIYIDEMSYFPKSQYKDQVDASSGAFNQLFKGKKKAGAFE